MNLFKPFVLALVSIAVLTGCSGTRLPESAISKHEYNEGQILEVFPSGSKFENSKFMHFDTCNVNIAIDPKSEYKPTEGILITPKGERETEYRSEFVTFDKTSKYVGVAKLVGENIKNCQSDKFQQIQRVTYTGQTRSSKTTIDLSKYGLVGENIGSFESTAWEMTTSTSTGLFRVVDGETIKYLYVIMEFENSVKVLYIQGWNTNQSDYQFAHFDAFADVVLKGFATK